MELQDTQNAWHRFELTGAVDDYLRYRSVAEHSGATAVREDGNAFEVKGTGAESPSNRGE